MKYDLKPEQTILEGFLLYVPFKAGHKKKEIFISLN